MASRSGGRTIGFGPEQIPVRAPISQLIVWWRTLGPTNAEQQAAYARLPGAIRLIDTISGWRVEHA